MVASAQQTTRPANATTARRRQQQNGVRCQGRFESTHANLVVEDVIIKDKEGNPVPA